MADVDGENKEALFAFQFKPVLDILTDYFYSWRPYKTILKRLNEVHCH